MLYRRQGNTTASHVRTCDTVSAGAFFPQGHLAMPQKARRQQRREHVVVPACLFPHGIVVHPAAVLPAAKHCSTAQRSPLSQTKGRKGGLVGPS